jgi:MFS family permease
VAAAALAGDGHPGSSRIGHPSHATGAGVCSAAAPDTAWILDGLEVTIVGAIASRLTDPDSGLALSESQVGLAGSVYVLGACLGALFFGYLTDRFGRKKLFIITLVVYLVATVATAFSGSALFFYACRFFTGAGIGGEYAAINSAIDELIPARVRGRVDLIINGSFWLGTMFGASLSLLLLDKSLFAVDLGWRIAFGLGAVLGLGILLVRRNVPESPRWQFIHGRNDQAEELVADIERPVEEETGERLEEVTDSIRIRQRRSIGFGVIAHTAFKRYPRRTMLGLALFVGQAFL